MAINVDHVNDLTVNNLAVRFDPFLSSMYRAIFSLGPIRLDWSANFEIGSRPDAQSFSRILVLLVSCADLYVTTGAAFHQRILVFFIYFILFYYPRFSGSCRRDHKINIHDTLGATVIC